MASPTSGIKQQRALSTIQQHTLKVQTIYRDVIMRKPINLIRKWVRDRRMAAMHEAGHVVIARMLCIEVGHAYIHPEEGDEKYEKTWLGHTIVNSRDLLSANRLQCAMFGVAGAVAELCWDGYDITWDDVIWHDPTIMSESDWEETECVPGVPDENCLEAISAVAAVLERGASHWDDLVSVARNLIIQSILRAAQAEAAGIDREALRPRVR